MRLIDAVADWLRDGLGARAQLRLGVLLTFGTLPMYAWLPFSGEPPAVYAMSTAALTLSGIGIVVGAEVLEKNE